MANHSRSSAGGVYDEHVATIYHDGSGDIRIRAPYAIKNDLKAIGCRWNPALRCWVVDAFFEDEVLDTLSYLGVSTRRVHRGEWQEHHASWDREPAQDWAAGLFEAMPGHLRRPVLKALLKVLHPDVGGDHQLAQELLAAYEQQQVAS